MMAYQFSKVTDEKLDELSRKILDAESQIVEATARKDIAWDDVIDVFDEFNRQGKEARFIASDGHTLALSERKGTPKLDEQKLYGLLVQKYGAYKADRLWKTITVSRVDPRLLEIAQQDHKIDATIINECVTQPEPSWNRLHPEWTKADEERAKIFGIERKQNGN